MKKLLLTLSVAIAIVSCEKDGSTDAATLVDAKDLNQDELDASYAFGISLGEKTEAYNKNPQLKDSLDYAKVKEGIQDFLKSGKDKTSYYYGVDVGRQIAGALENDIIKGHLSQDEIIKGMMDYLDKKDLRVSKDSVRIVMDKFYESRVASKGADNAKAGIAFMNKVKKESDVKTTPSGLAYKVIQEGTGDKVEIGDVVKVKYTGKTIDGKVFDSTDQGNNGEAIEFPLQQGGLIPGWIEGLQLMSKGGKYELYIPSELGYGNQASGAIEPGSTLIFDIEVVDITKGGAAQ
ncbi:MAG: FKBP-type peptidyl-prolyl cis-trans isomerase [Weeksellaceae bacterium]